MDILKAEKEIERLHSLIDECYEICRYSGMDAGKMWKAVYTMSDESDCNEPYDPAKGEL